MPEPRDQLEAYLDGLLSEAERAQVADSIASDPQLAAEVRLQQRVDGRLRETFAPPLAEAVLGPQSPAQRDGRAQHPTPSALAANRVRRMRSALALAAVLALAALAAWRGGWLTRTRDPYEPKPWRSLEGVYHEKLADGFNVDWECKDDEEFARTFRTRLRQPLLLASLPPHVQSLGLGYGNSISERTIFLLARVEGKEVIVFVDRLERDTPQAQLSDPNLHLFRREIDQLVLYELTPHPKPHVLDLFFNPKARTAP